MKKAIIVASLLILSFTFFQTSVNAAISQSFDAKLLESAFGLRKDTDVKITSSFKTTYKTGDILKSKWTLSGADLMTSYVGIVNVKGRDKMAEPEYFEDTRATQYTLDITDEIPSGEYVFMVIRGDTLYTVSKVFKIQTKTKELSDDEFINLSTRDVSNAREKGTNAALTATFLNARAQAELYYDSNGGYTNVCKKGSSIDHGIKDNIDYVKQNGGKKVDCDASANAWSAEVLLVGDEGYYCVDSTGVARVQAKSKGAKATGCDGSIDKTKKSVSNPKHIIDSGSNLIIKKILNLKSKYAPGSVAKISLRIEDAKGKDFKVSDNSIYVNVAITEIDNGKALSTSLLGYAVYNKRDGNYDLDFIIPEKKGEYSIDIGVYCYIAAWNSDSGSECYDKVGNQFATAYAYISVEGKRVTTSRQSVSDSSASNTQTSKSLIKIIAPNGGEKITDTGSVKITYSIPTDSTYFTQFFIMPSPDTKFTLTNPTEGIRGYNIGGTGSKYVNSTSVTSTPWSIGPMPVGKYKLRGYLYKYRDGVNYSVSEAIDMDESDEYFIIDTSNSNQY